MPKKDNKPNPKASTSDDEDPKPPTKPTGAIPKSHSYAGPQETEKRGRKKATTAPMSEDESDIGAVGGVWKGRTRSSATPQPEEQTTRRGLLARMRSKSKSKSPTKREKSKSKSPSPHRSLFGRRKKSKSPRRDPVEEKPDEEEEESSDEEQEEHRGERIDTMKELKTIMESSAKMTQRALTVRPGPDTEQLIETPADSSPLVSRADLYKANLGKLPDQGTYIEVKSLKGSPVEEDLTNTSSLSFTSLVQGVQLDDDSLSLQSLASGGGESKEKTKSEEASESKDETNMPEEASESKDKRKTTKKK